MDKSATDALVDLEPHAHAAVALDPPAIGDPLESNPAFQETLGYTEEELRTMTLYDVVAADRKSIDSNIRRITEQKHRSVG